MTYAQPNRAPEGCRSPLCGYLEQRERAGEHFDACLHKIPMHEGCAWHRTPQQIAIISAQADQIVSAARQPFEPRKRGL